MSESPAYLTVPEAQAYLRFPSASAFRVWAKRHGLPFCRRGSRTLLFLRRDLDEAVGNRRQQGAAGVKFGASALRHAPQITDAAPSVPLHSIVRGQ